MTELVDNYIDASIGTTPTPQIGILDADNNALDLEEADPHAIFKVVVAVPYDEVGVGISSYFYGKTLGAVVTMRKE